MATTYSKIKHEEMIAETANLVTANIKTVLPENIKVPNGTAKDPAGEITLGMGGGVTVTNELVESNSIILVTAQEAMAGTLSVENRTAGTSFDINSSGGIGDSGKKVAWLIINLE